MQKTAIVLATILLTLIARAQLDTSAKSLNAIIITANKYPQKQNETGKVVTVITQEEISRSIGKTVGELLNQQTGITIIGSQNTLGTNQDIYVRGAATGNALILIDGIPAYDPSSIASDFDINNFSMENIERIEIVKGAMSTLYGSDAVAGVINIITKKGNAKPFGLYLDLSGGTYNTYKAVIGINGSANNNSFNLQYSHLESKGFSTAYDSTGKMNFDKDGYNQNLISGSFIRNFSGRLKWKFYGQVGKYKTDLDYSAFTDDKDYTLTSKNFQTGTGLEYQYKRGKLYFNYNININEKDYLDDSTIDVSTYAKYIQQKYIGRSHFAELYTNINASKNIDVLVGTDYRFQNTDQQYLSISSYGFYQSKLNSDTSKMHQKSFYASAFLKELGGFHFEIGGRYNNHSKYGNNLTYTINPSYLINNEVKVFYNIASAFKAPSLYQLFDATVGLPTLQPEKSTTYEGGAEYTTINKTFNCRAVYFKRDIKNGIDYSYSTNKYFNYNKQKDYGIEIEAAIHSNKILFTANYTYVRGKVNTKKYFYDATSYSYLSNGDTTYNNLFRIPNSTINATFGFKENDKWFTAIHFRIIGKRNEYQYMAPPVTLSSYKTIDFYTEYKFSKKCMAFADLKNITNDKYFDILGYSSRQFNFIIGLNTTL